MSNQPNTSTINPSPPPTPAAAESRYPIRVDSHAPTLAAHPIIGPAGRFEESTAVLPRRFPRFPGAHRQPAVWPTPTGASWQRQAHPAAAPPRPKIAPRWLLACGAAAAVVVAVVANIGLIIALAGTVGTSTTTTSTMAGSPTSSSLPASTTTAPLAATVSIDSLPALLLDATTVNTVEATTGIALNDDINSGKVFADLATDRPECAGILHPAMKGTLQGSGWLAARTQFFSDGDQYHWKHLISDAVIDYPNAELANKFAAQQAQAWNRCAGGSLTGTSSSDNATFWVGAVANNDGMLSVELTQEGGRGWACQRALTVRKNIVVDTRSCGHNRTDQAIKLATAIGDRI